MMRQYEHQDTTPVILTKRPNKANATVAAQRAGLVSTEKKYGAGQNINKVSGGNARRLEEDSDNFGAPKTVDRSLSKAIAQARMAKKMTQKELANKINENQKVINELESGKAVPNGQILAKLDKALGTRLPRPGKGKK